MVSATDILHARILIVDDQEANVLLLERMLRGAGYDSVTSTMNPGEVCELHRKHRYDLILLDLLMRGMDGFQVMEGMKEIEPEGYLPVLVITAHSDHKLRALQAGAKDFVGKPLDMAEVLARVHNMLEVRLLHLETRKLYARDHLGRSATGQGKDAGHERGIARFAEWRAGWPGGSDRNVFGRQLPAFARRPHAQCRRVPCDGRRLHHQRYLRRHRAAHPQAIRYRPGHCFKHFSYDCHQCDEHGDVVGAGGDAGKVATEGDILEKFSPGYTRINR